MPGGISQQAITKETLKQTGKWLGRAWPVWAVLAIAVLNILAYRLIQYDRTSVHTVAGSLLQIIGGGFVLFSLNSNLGLFKQGTLRQRVSRWWADRPFRKRSDITLQAHAAAHVHVGGEASVEIVTPAKKLEERIEQLEKNVERFRLEMGEKEQKLRGSIEAVRQEMRAGHSEINKKISDVERPMATAVIGGANLQFFGILLVFYGTLLPVL